MNTTLEQMSNHLGFLGFTIETKKEGGGRERSFILARHPVSFDMSATELGPDVFLFKANVLSENEPGSDMDVGINAANRTLAVSRIYYDVEEGRVIFRIEATYLGKYDKETFANFMSHVERDCRTLPLVEEFKKKHSWNPAKNPAPPSPSKPPTHNQVNDTLCPTIQNRSLNQ